MATTTWNVSKDSRVAYRTSDGWEAGSGVSDGLPVGQYSGYRYRTLLGFSYSFSGMVEITSAILNIKTSSQIHVAFGSDPDIIVKKLTGSFSEGSSDALSSSNAVTWANQPGSSSTDQATKDVTTSEGTWVTIDITTMIENIRAAGATFYGLQIRANDETAAADVTEFYSSEFGTSHDAYISVTYSTNNAPNAPTSPTPTADTVVSGLTPTFAATFSDPDVGDAMTNAQVLVYADDGTTLIWDSGSFAAVGASFSKVYAGPALTGNTFYKWKGRTYDGVAWGAYTALNRFKVNSTPNAPTISLTESPTSDIKTLTPTFNITHSDPDPSDSSMTGYHIILETSGGSSVWDSGDLSISATVTKQHLYAGPALSWQTAYRWRARTKDSNGVWGAYSSNATFTTHTTGTPINLDPTGGEIASSLTPTLVGSRATTADSLTHAQIEVYASNGTTLIWDSGTTTTGVTSSGFSRAYAGSALSSATTYKWRARVTSSIGGVSAWSALQTFITPDTNTPSGTTPVGSGITPVTNLQFTFTRSATFVDHEFYLYQSDGTTLVTSDTPSSYAATGSKTFTYSGTLAYNTTYKWKVRVDSGGANWSPFTSLITFTTDSAGVPTQNAPAADSLLGAPFVFDEWDDITGVTNGGSASASLETGSGLFTTGIGSMKIAISGLAASGTSYTYRTLAAPLDLSRLGSLTPGSISVRYSSSTNVSTLRLRIEFATSADYVEYDIKPGSTGAFETKSFVKGTHVATGGTINWANVNKIGVRLVATGGGSVTTDIYVDDLKFDSTNPAFDGTTFNSEVVSTFRIRVYSDSDGTSLVWDAGDIAGSGTTFAKLYAGSALTKGQTYYWQARYVKSTGPTGNYSALIPFTINSDPSIPTSLSPSSGGIVADSLVPQFTATFGDNELSTFADYPTYMEVEVYRSSDSVLAYQLITKTGLIASANTIYDGLSGTVKVTGAAAPLVYETEYKYRVRYYDSKGARGTWSSYTTFMPSESPTATISSPADAGTVSSPSFDVTWGMSSPGGWGQNRYRVRVVRAADDVTLIDTGQVFSSATTYVVPAGYLVNGLEYDIIVGLWDVNGLSDSDTNTVTANWTAPDPIENFTVADDVSLSANILRWDASNLLGSDFRQYVIYRKLSTGTEWEIFATIPQQSTVIYYDYTAANTKTYEYKITQLQIVPGDVDLESNDSDIGSATLDTDSWFVVGADRAASHIFEVPVIAAPFAEPVQQEVFEPLGTSRKVIIRGRVMGAEGTLQGKWVTTERDAALEQIAYIKSNAGPHILKSPFGDVWNVEFSGPNKDYEAGGHFNASINWTEVA